MEPRQYELALSPEDAVKAFEDADAVDALYAGELRADRGEVHGSVRLRRNRVELQGQRFRRLALCVPLTARVEVDLVPSGRGSTFTLRRIPPRLHAVTEFRRIVAVGLLSVLVVAMLSPAVALGVLAAHLVLVGCVWLINRRGIAAVNDTLVSLVWSVWAPALVDAGPGVYRGSA